MRDLAVSRRCRQNVARDRLVRRAAVEDIVIRTDPDAAFRVFGKGRDLRIAPGNPGKSNPRFGQPRLPAGGVFDSVQTGVCSAPERAAAGFEKHGDGGSAGLTVRADDDRSFRARWKIRPEPYEALVCSQPVIAMASD